MSDIQLIRENERLKIYIKKWIYKTDKRVWR